MLDQPDDFLLGPHVCVLTLGSVLAPAVAEEVAHGHGLPVARYLLFRKDLGGPLAGPLASAGTGKLVGPVATPNGFALVVVEQRLPAELDAATRQRIQDELFDAWLACRLSEATFDLKMAGPSA